MIKNTNASLGFIFVTVLIDMIGVGIIIPVLPDLIISLEGGSYSDASRVGGFMIGAYAVMQFLFAPFIGELSDHFGRKPVLLISLFALSLDFIMHALAPSIFWLFIGRILAGITGASYTVASAYIADISTPEKRAQNFGLIGAAFGLGFIIGPALGGIASEWGIRAPFFLAAALAMLNFLYGAFILPESHTKENRRKINFKKANPVLAIVQLANYPKVTGFFISYFLIYVAGHSVQSTWSFFSMFQFNWDAKTVGYSLTLVGVVVALVQAFGVRFSMKWFGEIKTVIIGMSFWIIGLIAFSFAFESWQMFVIIIPYCLGGIASPALQAIMSNQVEDSHQGELQGSLTSIASLTNIIGPVLMTSIFYKFTQEDTMVKFPGAAFLLGAFLMFLAFVLVLKPLKKYKSI